MESLSSITIVNRMSTSLPSSSNKVGSSSGSGHPPSTFTDPVSAAIGESLLRPAKELTMPRAEES